MREGKDEGKHHLRPENGTLSGQSPGAGCRASGLGLSGFLREDDVMRRDADALGPDAAIRSTAAFKPERDVL
jgi:hypothetical protein